MMKISIDSIQVDSTDEEEEDSASDMPRKRQRTASRKGEPTHPPPPTLHPESHTNAHLPASKQPTPVFRSADSDSESDGYVNARKNIPSKKERQRQLLVAEGRLPPSQAEVRFSARRTKAVTNYNEDEDEDPFIEDEDDTTPNYWPAAAEETGPVIDKVLDHRPKDGIGMHSCAARSHSLARSLTLHRARSLLCAEEGF